MFQHTSSNKLILSLSREPLITFKQRLLRQDNEMSADALIIQQKAERVLVRGIHGSASELVREVSVGTSGLQWVSWSVLKPQY